MSEVDTALELGARRAWAKDVRRWAGWVESPVGQAIFALLIVGNAAVVGLGTYERFARDHAHALDLVDTALLGAFSFEIGLRLINGGWSLRFWKSGWNVFDFVIVGAAYLPFVRESITLLRLARLLRVSRLIALVPSLRIVLGGIIRSLAPLASVGALTFALMYVYAIVGWMLFGDADPQRFGSAHRGLLTVFQLLTVEGWNDVLAAEADVAWGWLYFVSFILLGSFLVLNVVIAVVINSVEEARGEDRRRRIEELEAAVSSDAPGPLPLEEARELVGVTIADVHQTLEEFNESLRALLAGLAATEESKARVPDSGGADADHA